MPALYLLPFYYSLESLSHPPNNPFFHVPWEKTTMKEGIWMRMWILLHGKCSLHESSSAGRKNYSSIACWSLICRYFGNGYPLQYSGLKNSMECTVRGVTTSQTWLSNFHLTLESVSQEIEEGHVCSLALLDEHLLYAGALDPQAHPSALLPYIWEWAFLKPQWWGEQNDIKHSGRCMPSLDANFKIGKMEKSNMEHIKEIVQQVIGEKTLRNSLKYSEGFKKPCFHERNKILCGRNSLKCW